MARSGPPDPMPVLSSLGWTWYDNGAVVTVAIDGVQQRVWVPLRYIWALFHQEMQAAGCPLAQEVGAPFTSVGFFKSLSRAVKRGFRKVKRTVRRAGRKVKRGFRRAGRAFKRAIPRRLRRAARRVGRLAKRIARGAYKVVTSRQARLILAGLATYVPALTPTAASLLAAQRALKVTIEGTKAAQALARGVRATPQLVRAMRKGARARNEIERRAKQAKRGSKAAQQFMGAMAQMAA